MKITKEQINPLNAVITVSVDKSDYNDKVEKALTNYRKNASVPGFRKGCVPASLVKKQYGRAIQVDEVNKLLQEALNKYLIDEKLNILGNPLPKETEVDWDADTLVFDFEIGLAPEFSVNLNPENGIRYYEISVEDSVIDNQMKRIATQFGKLVTESQIVENVEVTGTFFNQEKNIDKTSTFNVELLSDDAFKTFKGKKVGDQFTLNTKNLFKDAHDLMHQLGVSHDDAHHLEVEVTFTIEEINRREPAEFTQELFDRLFPAGEVTSEQEMRNKIAENAQMQYNQQADQQFFNDVTDYLLENTQFELPSEFLTKWLQTATDKPLTEEQATEEYKKSEKGLRYQLIEGKVLVDNKLQVTFEELKAFAGDNIRQQMLQFGMPIDELQVEDIVKRILTNREETERLSQQLVSQKLLSFYKENITLNKKQCTFDEFIKEVYE